MSILVCPGCRTTYDSNKLAGKKIQTSNCCSECADIVIKYECPDTRCWGDDLIEVDEDLALTIIDYWNAGVQTFFCCSGHLSESTVSPYLCVGFTTREKRRAFYKIVKLVMLEEHETIFYDTFQNRENLFGFIDEEHTECENFYTFCIRALSSNDDIDKIITKTEFHLALLSILNKWRKQCSLSNDSTS